MLGKLAAGPVWDQLCETKNHVMLNLIIRCNGDLGREEPA